jgi:acyl-CoA synthetase (NDP forming)
MSLPLDKILRPKSIAVVGVSERPEAIGTRVLNNLRKMGFSGPLYPVNPRYETIDGMKCYPSLSALPETVDAAFLAVPSSGGPDLVEEAGQCGIRALFTNANGYADGDADGVALQRRLEAAAAKHGIAICGPNNLGMVNAHDRIAMWTPRYMKVLEPGSLGVISQSGSIALILSEDERDLGFAYLVTAGNEAVLNVADYLSEMAKDDRV